MAHVVKMRCPKCNRVVDTFSDEGSGQAGTRTWRPRPDGQRRRHPVGYVKSDLRDESKIRGLPYHCHRKCGRTWQVKPVWLFDKIAAGADFVLP